jgi:ABC-type bacteriocin/lantibiotic exporter with double-glycine peptidase domain
MQSVKTSGFEHFYSQSIDIIRKEEVNCVKKVNIYKGVANFVMSLAPLASILIIIIWEEQLKGDKLSVSETFAIVSIIGNMGKPLKEFMDILDEYYLYK